MHHALFEMAKARVELKEAAHDFGGHREKALKAIDEAIPHMEKALEAAGDKYVAVEPSAEVYKKYESHPHLHHALHEMEEAHTELKEAKHDFGGHRKKALEKVDHAIEELKEAVKSSASQTCSLSGADANVRPLSLLSARRDLAMSRVCLLVVLLTAPVLAAPVPKQDPELERIAKVYGTLQDLEGCKLSMDGKNVLTVKLEKVRPPKEPKAGEKGEGLKIPVPTSASFGRTAKGEFTTTARFQLKTDLTKRPDEMGVSVGVSVEYPSGVSAGINCSFSTGQAAGLPDGARRVVAGFGSHTSDGTPNSFRGRGTGGGNLPSGEGPQNVRVRCTGKKLLLEHSADGQKWETYDELAIKEAGEAKIKLMVMSFHGAETEVVIDVFEVK
jgi:hypothetical protein